MPDGPGSFTQDSSCPALLRIPASSVSMPRTGLSPSMAALSRAFRLSNSRLCRSYNPGRTEIRPVWAPPVSLAATPGITFCFLLLPLLRCFSSRRSPPSRDRLAAGFPHSDTRGSKVVCTSPRLFAAYRVLLRLLEPGHPPCALLSLLLLGVNRLSTSTPVSCSVCQCASLSFPLSVEVTLQA